MNLLGRAAWTVPALVLALAGQARAAADVPEDAPAAVEDAEPALVPHWYGGRVLLADGASVAVLAAGGALRSTPVLVAGLAGWFLAAPVVHARHATFGRGAASFALRVGLPTLGLLVGQAASRGCWNDVGASDSCEVGAGAGGLFLGVLAAEIVDIALLARDAHPAEPPPEHAFASPVVVPQQGGAVMGLAGRF
jgi:hypothetical protein